MMSMHVVVRGQDKHGDGDGLSRDKDIVEDRGRGWDVGAWSCSVFGVKKIQGVESSVEGAGEGGTSRERGKRGKG